MEEGFITITADTIDTQHLCCAISDKKHQAGVEAKKQWMKERIPQGHTFYRLDQKGKVFIEYAPVETAWVPVLGDGFLYIHCLWVAGSFKGQGHGHTLLTHCINDAKAQGKAGVCILSAKTKKPFLSDKKFMLKYGFEVVDTTGDYELLALCFAGEAPRFTDGAKKPTIQGQQLTIYYSPQCPYTKDCVAQVECFCKENDIPLQLNCVDSLEKGKEVPCVFNNWAVFYQGKFQTVHLLNEGQLKKLLKR